MPSRKAITEFLAQKRIAVAGVSRNPREYSSAVFRTLKEKGYEVYPINPHAEEVEGVRCYKSVKDVPGPLDGVVAVLPVAQEVALVRECREAGIPRVWLRMESTAAESLAKEAGIAVVNGACPIMFLGGGLHTVHRWFTRLEA
ncbi:MAG TPA: CoA-binding protein [Symbiobacteriaceae bacterium]|nr:CoA-binding protein [Symbiobacteriaceae bacterium]